MERPWRKILYEKQDYSDNYVDTKQFLNGLKRNCSTHSDVQISRTSYSFRYHYTRIQQETWLLPTSLLACSVIVGLSVVGYNSLVFVYQSRHKPLAHFTAVTEYGVSAIVFILFLCAVSPILKTLTEAISTDTIWAMTVGMLSVHLVFHNYGPEQDMVSNSISLNAAIFAAVCLASRLPTTFHVFSIVFFAVGLFALLPQMRKAQHPLVLTVTSVLITTYLLWWASLLLSLVLYTLTVLTITILAPAWLLKLQHLKNNIYGPWDEAVVQCTHQLSSSLNPGINIKDNVYFEFGVMQVCARSGEEAVMKKSVITADFETKETVPAVFPSRHTVERMKKAESGKSAGKQWFNMAAPELTTELKNDLKALQLRNAIDPKQHYKANDSKELPKYFQVGRVVAGPAEYYSARIPRRQQKRSLVEELFADEELRRYQKKKHTQLQRQHQSGTHRLKKIKHGKKYKRAAA